MCFQFGSCFGNGRRQDCGGERSTPKAARRERRGDSWNGYYSGTDHQPHATAVDEAGHKTYHDHDGARKDHHTAAYAYVQEKLANNETPKHNKVGDDAGYSYAYTARLQEAAADRRENAAMDYHHYPTTTANTTTLVTY